MYIPKFRMHLTSCTVSEPIEYCAMHNDSELHDYLLSMPAVVHVGSSCCLRYKSKCRFGQFMNISNSDNINDSDGVLYKALQSPAVGVFD